MAATKQMTKSQLAAHFAEKFSLSKKAAGVRKYKAAGGKFIECHTSGHIFAEDIVKFVSEVNPKWVVPIHTTSPALFGQHFANVLFPKDGERVDI